MVYDKNAQITKACNLSVGDVIFTDLAQTDLYENYPYVVTLIKEDKIYAYKTTYTNDSSAKTLFKVPIKVSGIKEPRNFVFKQIIPDTLSKEQTIIKVGSMTSSEINTINKKIYYKLFDEEFAEEFPYSQDDIEYTNAPLDVIENDNRKFAIYAQSRDDLFVYEVFPDKNVRFGILGVGHGIDRKETFKLPRDHVYKVLKVLDAKDVFKRKKKVVEKNEIVKPKIQKEIEIAKEEERTAQRGDIVLLDQIKYLVYGEYKEFWQIYRLYGVSGNGSLFKIELNNYKYKTDFKGKLLLKKKKYKVFDHISDEDLKELAKKRKAMQKNDTGYIRPLFFTKKNTVSLSYNQKKFLAKLQEYGFTEEEIVGIMITLCQETDLELILDYMTDVNNKYIIKKEDILEKVLEIVRS